MDGEGECLTGSEVGVSGQAPENMQGPSVTTLQPIRMQGRGKIQPGRYMLIPPRAKCPILGSEKEIKGLIPPHLLVEKGEKLV